MQSWGCFSVKFTGALLVIAGNMNGVMYWNILEEKLTLSAKKLNDGCFIKATTLYTRSK